MKNQFLTTTQLQVQLDKYKAQLNALEVDESYTQFEEERTTLRNFYNEKISEFTAEINKLGVASGSFKQTAVLSNVAS